MIFAIPEVTVIVPYSQMLTLLDRLVLNINSNPFNGTTTAILNLSEAGRVSLEVFDMFGRTVAGTTFDGVLAGGQHQFRIHLNNAGTYVLAARQKARVV